jgi:hypothetical protein
VNVPLARFISDQDDGITPGRPRNRRVTRFGDAVNNTPTIFKPTYPNLADYVHFEPSYFIKTPMPSSVSSPPVITFRDIDIVPGMDLMVPTAQPPYIQNSPNPAALAETMSVHSFYLTWISQSFGDGQLSQHQEYTELPTPFPPMPAYRPRRAARV